jgi:hypothetical protein
MQRPPPPDLTDVVFLRSEALADGYTDHQIARKVRSGAWHRVRRGAYISGDLWRALSKGDRHRVLARAVLRTSHPFTVLTHLSAAVERGAPIYNVRLDEVHTTRTDGKAARREAGKVQHRGVLPQDQVEVVNGVPVSSAARCAVEMTTIADVESALVTVNGLLHSGQLTAPELAAMAHDTRHWPESLSANLVARLADPRLESAGESRTAYLCWVQHLPQPTPQVDILDEHGDKWARVDFAWPEYGVFLEFDGREKYRRFRREGETLEQFLMREKTREEKICQLTGWVCIRITWADLSTPEQTANRIRRILISRTSMGA